MDLQHNKRLGQSGEDLAADFLISNGYKIIIKNFPSAYGEIDIIALRKETLVFIEVKTRRTNNNLKSSHETALNSVSLAKRTKLLQTASIFLSQNPVYEHLPSRFDVITIVGWKNNYQLVHLKDAF